jgi:NDP-sugar pyrophosphorylase family protein
VLGAIVIVGSQIPGAPGSVSAKAPLACVEILGCSVLERVVADLGRIGMDAMTVIGDRNVADCVAEQPGDSVPIAWADDAWHDAMQSLRTYSDSGIETAVIVSASTYAEIETHDVLQFHRQQNDAVTRVFDTRGPLDFWVVDTARLAVGTDLRESLELEGSARYAVCGYVNRLEHVRDLRRLAIDSLNSRCRLRPQGFETRPGLWVDEGAQVHRKARIVAPAYLGRGSRIDEQCLITRCSNVESNSEVDFGTAVEDSSILSDSYVGIDLDLTHSVVDGSRLFNLQRDVSLDISDPGIIRRTGFRGKGTNPQSPVVLGLGLNSICARRERRDLHDETATEDTCSLFF